MFTKVLIANRGEIACRVIRTCKRLGVSTVAVYSDADADAQHVRLADTAIHIGGARPADSYLRGDAIIEAALATGAQAIHPGYGFLSENADFADAVEAAGLVFIGPKASSMRRMGSKAGAKELMSAAGVPVVPGYTGEDQSPDLLHREADRIGYPLMIKAAHGGGGKGMRIVHASDEFAERLESCQREARNAFGRDRVLLERYVQSPRHIEIQVFGDTHGHAIHLGERECSAQRRFQKVLEESPSPFLTPAMRASMGEAAVMAARAIDYVNAGTVEFIVAPDGAFYFMEINTRLQVEHPVTECVTGFDLVEWQLRIAAGDPLPVTQDEVTQTGHAIEVRLYAEDPDAGFLPGSGRLDRLRLPVADAHVRIDTGVVEGDTVTIFYDPMIAKLIVHDADRPRALQRMRDALAHCDITGPKSNIAFLERLVRHPTIVQGTIDTAYLDRHLDQFVGSSHATPDAQTAGHAGDAGIGPSINTRTVLLVGAGVLRLQAQERDTARRAAASGDPTSPWAIADGWRLGHGGRRRVAVLHDEARVEFEAHGHADAYAIDLEGARHHVDGVHLDGAHLVLRINARSHRLRVVDNTFEGDRGHATLHDGERRLRASAVAFHQTTASVGAGTGNRVLAPMPGRVVMVRAAVGDVVVIGQELLVIEAMKMELSLKSPRDGTIAAISAQAGEQVDADAVLVTLEE